MTRLYIYDHCPYCVRATMVANYKQVPFERVILANDDEKSCYDLTGKKELPILEHEGAVMGESLDICRKLDRIGSAEQVIEPGTELSARVDAVLSSVSTDRLALSFARITRIGLPEFATESAREYFRRKKESLIKESFEQALANSDGYKARVEAALSALPRLTTPLERGDRLSWDDVMIFPHLRSLTLVKDLHFPKQVIEYLNGVAELTGGDLYFDRAI